MSQDETQEPEIIKGFKVYYQDPATIELSKPGRKSVWPFADFRVGQWINIEDPANWPSAYVAVRYIHSKTDKRFTLQKWPPRKRLEERPGVFHWTPYTALKVQRVA